jgi:hypothetical protein
MSLLWVKAMAWLDSERGDESGAVPAKSVGFKGYVGISGWKGMERDIAEFNGRQPFSRSEDRPDHVNDDLHGFIAEHARNGALWQSKGRLGKVDISKGVYATQSHVHNDILDRYRSSPGAKSWSVPDTPGAHLDVDHPMFVQHGGRLHVIEGHHRVGAALQAGQTHVHGWVYDADKHGLNPGQQAAGVA